MGVKPGGSVLILGGAGPMGLGAVEYPLAIENKTGPRRGDGRGQCPVGPCRAIDLFLPTPKSMALNCITSIRTKRMINIATWMDLTGGAGYDDVFVYAPIKELVELGDRLLAFDGCLSFFAGPTDKEFRVEINLYNWLLHQHPYHGHHGRQYRRSQRGARSISQG